MLNEIGGPVFILAALYVAWPLFIIWASIAAVNALKRIADAAERMANDKLPQDNARSTVRDKSDPAYKYIRK